MRTLAIFMALCLAPADRSGAQGVEETRSREALHHHRAGVELMQSERFEAAAGEFKTAVTLDPHLVIAHYNLGQSFMALKRYVEAAMAYQGCRDSIERLNGLGQREREALSRAHDDEIRELKDSLVRVRTGQIKYVNVEQQVVRIEERIRVLEDLRFKGAEVARVPAEVPLALGSAYFRQGKLAEAEREYGQAIKANRKLGPAHNNLAVVYMLTGRFAEAHQAIKQAEGAGYRVSPAFKADLSAREAGKN